MATNLTNQSQPLALADILVEGAELTAQKLELTEALVRLLDETRQRQDEILRLKEVNQERLRMVVQL